MGKAEIRHSVAPPFPAPYFGPPSDREGLNFDARGFRGGKMTKLMNENDYSEAD